MTNAASLSLGLILLIGTASIGWSQSTPTTTAVDEAIRRQAATIKLRRTLDEARSAESRRDLNTAAKLYEQSYKLVQEIGDPKSPEAVATVTGLCTVQLELARSAQSRGDLDQAKILATHVLKVDPKNQAAIAFMKQNDKLLAEQRGLRPTPEAVQQAKSAQNEHLNANTLVQDGRLLLEMGKLDEAEAKLKQATALDPENRAAFYYLGLLKEARYGEAERKRELGSKEAIVKIEQDWVTKPKRELLTVPNPAAHPDLIYTSKGRQAIVAKLNRIHLDTIGPWDNLPLSEVIRVLSEESRKRDPEKRGLNFILNPNAETAAVPPAGVAPVVDPATGLPIAPTGPAEVVDINSVAIKINPALNDVRLVDVLEAITHVADKPIKFSVEDYAVMFSLKGQEPQQLFNRTYKVDPNTFYQGLESVGSYSVGDISNNGGGNSGGGGNRGGGGGGNQNNGNNSSGSSALAVPRVYVAGGGGGGGGQGNQGGVGGGGGGGLRFVTRTNGTDEASVAVKNFFAALGVNLDPALGKSVFFNDRLGLLLVRATLQDLDTIEAAIQVLNVAPPQITINTKFAEITQTDTKGVGFDWYLGNYLMNNGAIVGSGGTQPTLFGQPSSANPSGFFPGNPFFGTAVAPSTSDGLVTSGLRTASQNGTAAPAIATLTGILTDPQFRVVIKAIEQRSGVDLLNAPQVTTPSGRQAQIQIVDLQTIVTGTSINQTGSGGTTTTDNGLNNGGGGVVGTTIDYPTSNLPFGTTLDVIPYVSADGYTVQMTIIPTITEFVGYDDPGQFIPQGQSVSSGAGGVGLPLTAQLPLPRIRLRQVTTSAIVWDGQTVVLGGLISENATRFKDKVPVLGDMPLVGKLFRSEGSQTSKKNLVIFVTPTIIDPSGNRWNEEGKMPFNENTIPPQRPIAPVP